jgi:sodium-dependent dicarboxylate transporter 2/3/5
MDPLGMMYLVAISSGLAFCLPMSSPPNAIAFSSGYYGIGDAVVRGLIMTIVALVVFLLTVWLYWPWMGVNLWAG